MESLANQVFLTISTSITEYINLLGEKMDIDTEQALELWNSHVGEKLQTSNGKEKPKRSRGGAGKKKTTSSDSKCIYVFSKGSNAGGICGSATHEDSVTGNYCKKHLSQETKDKETKSAAAKPKTTAKSKAAKAEDKPVINKLKNSNQPMPGIKINKHKNYEHETTGFLFDNVLSEVYGKQGKDGSVTPLTVEDIEDCKRLGFKYRLPAKLESSAEKEGEDDEKEDDSDEEGLDEEDEDDDEEEN